MTRPAPIAAVLVTVAAVLLVAAHASAQYATPLRYDLRYSTPNYIPSGSIRANTPRNDPYAFGNVNTQDLIMTGNVRGGKSFQGNTPFGQTGSELSRDLPSLRLSNFRRDSVGLEDLGSGVEYGAPAPYFPRTGAVTTPYTAATRFQPTDTRYGVPNYNVGALPPATPTGTGLNPSALPGGVTQEEAAAGAVTGIPAGVEGLSIPRSALEYVDALIDGRYSAAQLQALAVTAEADSRGITGPADTRLGATAPMVQPLDAGQTRPGNIFDPDAAPAGEGELEKRLADQIRREALDSAWTSGEPRSAKLTNSLALPGATAPPAEDAPDESEGATLPAPSLSYRPASAYDEYVRRADEYMKQGRYDQAESMYASALTMDPDKPAAAFGRVNAIAGGRLYLQAIVVLTRFMMRHPEWAKEIPDIRAALAKEGAYDRVVSDLKHTVAISPTDPGHKLLLGYVLFAGDDKETARRYLEGAAIARKTPGPEIQLLELMQKAKPE